MMENPLQINAFPLDLDNEDEKKNKKIKSRKVFSKLPFTLYPSEIKNSSTLQGNLIVKKDDTLRIKNHEKCSKNYQNNKKDIDEYMDRKFMEHTDILEMSWNKNERIKPAPINYENDEVMKEKIKHMQEQLISRKEGSKIHRCPNEFEETSKFVALQVYFAWFILFIHAYFREFLRSIGLEKLKYASELQSQKHFTPLFNSFESIYARNCYILVRDVFERPIGSCPGGTVNLIDRISYDGNWTYEYPGTQTNVINVGSYNYLGFAQTTGPCANDASKAIDEYGISVATTIREGGTSIIHNKLEKLVAEFLGTEDAMVFSMGFATNSMNAPCLVDKHSLIISDQLNHASLILGCRMSGASIRVFKHDDMLSLEQTIRNAIAYGNPKTHRPYHKILIIVEGIYSMEGSICNLPAIIALKKKYKCYLYLDEAHSIGAMGDTGKGIVEYWGCDVNDIDIMMGTFTKSFGSAGGYIAGKKRIIDHLRVTSATSYYSSPMSPPIAQQVYTSMGIIMGKDGTDDGRKRIEQLARNSRYFRRRLKKMGLIVYGSDDSPVVPILFYYPTICGSFGREMLARKVGVVVVSHPATPMTESRARICLSAAHTKEMLDDVLKHIDEVGEILGLKFMKHSNKYKNLEIEW